jgi:hypothetical protein
MADVWETAVFGGTGAGPNGNPDGDSWNNLEEFLLGTDPFDAASGLSVTQFQNNGAAPAKDITWTSVHMRNYGVYSSSMIGTGPWTLVDTMKATGAITSFTDAAPGAAGHRSYRIELVP